MEPPPSSAIPDRPVAGEIASAQPEYTPVNDSQDPAWREELSARLNRYRARRKAPPPRYPSLRLPFEAEPPAVSTPETSTLPVYDTIANHALALDAMPQRPPQNSNDVLDCQPLQAAKEPAAGAADAPPTAAHSTAKIIEFPGFAWGPPEPPPDQLAEPVTAQPRILEVPELAPAPPALGGITIESQEREEAERRPGIDIPRQSARLSVRLFASLIDGLIISVASALFGLVFWKITRVRPPLVQLAGLAAGVPILLWHVYQYLLIVYSASTPGLRIAGLRLSQFDGNQPRRSLRRWRCIAACLSAASLGMGYVWLFLDEDALCWHDRITHTYLAPRKAAGTSANANM